MTFTHLQVRSGFSLLDSTNTIDKLVERADELQFKALALTDEEVLYGAIYFYKKCLKHGLKPIIGMVVNLIHEDQNREPCILLAKNNTGFQHLMKISTIIQKQQESGMTIEKIEPFMEGLIGILPIHSSKLATLLHETSHEPAYAHMATIRKLFKQKDFYLGIQDHGLVSDQSLHHSIKAFHHTYQVPVVAINDVRYIKKQDDIAYDCLQAIKEDKKWTITDTEGIQRDHHLRSAEEMETVFASFWPEVLAETERITAQCHVSFDLEARLIPSYPVPISTDAHTYLEKLCWQNIPKRYVDVTPEIKDRLTYELAVIQKMEFSDYFLIVWDFIAYANKNNILVGPGRGSSAGSIVAYLLQITDVDPIQYGLIFERFLNIERLSMPDIDIDFSDHRRDEVIDYVRQKYGEEHVAQIITFGTYGARSILRELFKTMNIDEQDAQFILSKIPSLANQKITEYVKRSSDLKEYIKESKQLRLLFTIATKLEGLPRHISTHAAGVIISEQPLIKHVPLTTGSNQTNLTQFPMNDLEAIGLLKMDFLGLRNLTIIERILQSIYRTNGTVIRLKQIPSYDEQTYQLLQSGRTNGVFQLESQGMKQVLSRLKPTSFEDIVAVNALYRPGPMDYIPTYIKRKHGEEEVQYLHADLIPILNKTYGVLIYQEQIMQIVHKFAGLSLGEADIFRRAISNKQMSMIEEQRDVFMDGCVRNGYDATIAEQLFTWIVKFSNYGFNRSHAVAYSKISYQLAYLKARYPAHFFVELLGSMTNQTDKIHEYSKEAKEMQLVILPPSINKSFGRYAVENNQVRMGLLSIKGIGQQIVREILAVRKEGRFTNLFDFCSRISLKIVNRKSIELLIMAGTFDETYENRASLLASVEQAINQGELFGGINDEPSLLPNKYGIKEIYTEIEDFTQMKKLTDEKELLGIYVSSHPLKEYRVPLRNNGYVSLLRAQEMGNQKAVKCAVIIQSIKKIRTKRGDPMAFMSVGDETEDIETVIFPELYRAENRWLTEERLIIIQGKIEMRNGRIQMLISEMKPFDETLLMEREQRLFIKITKTDSEKELAKIKEIAARHRGNIPIFVYHKERQKTYKLSENYGVHSSHACVKEFENHFGKASVVLE